MGLPGVNYFTLLIGVISPHLQLVGAHLVTPENNVRGGILVLKAERALSES